MLELAAKAAIQIRGVDGSGLQALGKQRLVANHQKTNIVFPAEPDLVDRGRKLQLVLYALAAQRTYELPEGNLTAYYWFVDLGALHRGAAIGSERRDRLLEVLDVAVRGIREGVFPAQPGEWNSKFGWGSCGFCEYDRACASTRGELWEDQHRGTRPGLCRADRRSRRMTRLPADEAARVTVRTAHDRTLFVEAGAGTGKTTELVARVIDVVATRAAQMSSLAAITFTENAAAELRTRIREALEAERRDSTASGTSTRPNRNGSVRGTREIDDAAISTLHGFAARVLQDVPLEAGLPPGFAINDAIRARLEANARWSTFLDDLLADDDVTEHLLLAAHPRPQTRPPS